jgi:transcriptional regulator with PAS, ATPase and Fis domain
LSIHRPAAGTVNEVLREHVLETLERHGGNRAKAARELGVGRTTLWRWLEQWAREVHPELAAPLPGTDEYLNEEVF